ncbi:MAG TPA: hypothetical protein VFN57_12210, partial [Thermomicrobiaceae bacterium]|nr:hypothetical protein [Thermomicrobiaceae bacterium]
MTTVLRSAGTDGQPVAVAEPGLDALARSFPAIIFDWDGTAVTNRRERADALVTLAQALLARGVWLIVITGTNYGNVDRQFCSRISPSTRHHLLVCTNRGSEVFGFDRRGRRIRRAARVATPTEDRALDAVAEDVRDVIRRDTDLAVGIVYDRLNRRKIDLIPLPEWQDPPKARIGDLLQAVEDRLRAAGWSGGLGAAIRLTASLAREHGLGDARITSDVKHIEVGLTDKGDALTWVRREHLGPLGIAEADVLIVGDEFGPVGGFVGSDDRLRAERGDAVVISVGPEPNGVPDGVLHLGGGPARFRALLAGQVWRHVGAASGDPAGSDDRLRAEGGDAVVVSVGPEPNGVPDRVLHLGGGPTRFRALLAGQVWRHVGAASGDPAGEGDLFASPSDQSWQVSESGYSPAIERAVESRLTVSNGFVGVRASLLQPTDASDPGTLVAGLFGTPGGDVGGPGLVDAPDWLAFQLAVDGQPLEVDRGRTVTYRRTLDLARGILHSEWEHELTSGPRVRLRGLRFASQADRSLAVEAILVETDRPVA